jgi:hypothetical protein
VDDPWTPDDARRKAAFPRAGAGPLPEVRVKLTRVYPKDGRQYGVVEIALSEPLPAAPQAGIRPGSAISGTLVYDGCIDGSVTDGELKWTHRMNLSSQDPNGNAVVKRTSENSRTITIRPAGQ